MRNQYADYITYRKKRYVLIDCELGKSIIQSAEFRTKNAKPDDDPCCIKGYIAQYQIIDGILYGRKFVGGYHYYEGCEEDMKELRKVKLPTRTRMNYTGSIVIGYDKNNSKYIDGERKIDYINRLYRLEHANMIADYLYYPLVKELYFENGVVIEEKLVDVKAAIKEWSEIEIEDAGYCTEDWGKNVYNKRQIAKKYLKYKYGNNYKWTYGR